MLPSNSIAGRRSEINELIAGDELSRATKLLMDFTNDFSESNDDLNEVIVIRASYARLEKRERQGVLSFDEAEKRKTKLLFQILGFMDSIQEGFIFQSESLLSE